MAILLEICCFPDFFSIKSRPVGSGDGAKNFGCWERRKKRGKNTKRSWGGKFGLEKEEIGNERNSFKLQRRKKNLGILEEISGLGEGPLGGSRRSKGGDNFQNPGMLRIFGMRLILDPRPTTFPEDGDVENIRIIPKPFGNFPGIWSQGRGRRLQAGGAPALTNAGN